MEHFAERGNVPHFYIRTNTEKNAIALQEVRGLC